MRSSTGLAPVGNPTGLTAQVEYSTELFERATIERLLGHLQTLLLAIEADPRSAYRRCRCSRRENASRSWCSGTHAQGYPDTAPLHELFEAESPDP